MQFRIRLDCKYTFAIAGMNHPTCVASPSINLAGAESTTDQRHLIQIRDTKVSWKARLELELHPGCVNHALFTSYIL